MRAATPGWRERILTTASTSAPAPRAGPDPVQALARAGRRPCSSSSRPDDHPVLPRLDRQDIEPLARRDAEAAPLPDRVAVGRLALAQVIASHGLEPARAPDRRGRREALRLGRHLALHELAHAAGDEAQLHALALLGGEQPGVARQARAPGACSSRPAERATRRAAPGSARTGSSSGPCPRPRRDGAPNHPGREGCARSGRWPCARRPGRARARGRDRT